MNNELMDNASIEEIFRRYYEQKATPGEKDILFRWVREPANADRLIRLIEEMGLNYQAADEVIIEANRAEDLIDKILLETREKRPAVLATRWWKYASIAALLILLAGTYWLFKDRSQKTIPVASKTPSQPIEIRPGGNRAVLTLANGKQIILDSVATGNIADEARVKVIKMGDGQISYEDQPGLTEVLFNTISTPIGGQYQIVLADGSKVWLNAASSLRYPTSFAGKERIVELQGEGYFEIAHDATKPFRVQVNGTTVEVLGTHFNINAYNDEPQLKTTLLEGKVKIENGGVVRFLKPGQQAVVEGEGKLARVIDADVEEAVAWKNGKFIFNGNDIHSVMRQLSRWYTITVQYNGQISDDEFVGIIPIPRSENISAILSLLQKTRTVSFQVNGRNVTVSPYKN
jgi:ferric-dicitrate binding protein FerR (iron transport regulator)